MKAIDISSYIFRPFTLIALFFILSISQLNAQFTIYGIAENGNDKNHGTVISYEPMNSVVMVCQGDTMTFDLNEYDFRFTTRRPPKPYIFPDGVGYHRVALGVLPGRPGDGGYVNYSYHYQKNRFIGYGGGIAFENYGDEEGYDFIIPSVNFYSYLRPKNTSPFFRLSAGYGIALKNASKFQVAAQGGLNLGAAFGLRLSTNRVMIDFAIGTKFQQANYEFDFGDYTRISDVNFNRLDFSIGFMW